MTTSAEVGKVSYMHLLFYTTFGDVIATSTPSLTVSLSLFLSILLRIFRLSTPVGLGVFSPQSHLTSGLAVPMEQGHVTGTSDFQVLILGGGVTGVMAAETLHRRGIDNFKIIEARETLGGRMKSFLFGAAGREYVLELGADWIHGTQTNNGPSNPIFDLARKHNLSTQPNHYRGSMSMFGDFQRSPLLILSTFFSNLRPHWSG
jgi:Flavin containing amine oxidoreductase